MRVEGLYDRVAGDWLRVAYAFEPAAESGRSDQALWTGTGVGVGADEPAASNSASVPEPMPRETADGG